MISSIIFSKDRALQLDLTLKSILQNFSQCNQITVITKCSKREHCDSYKILREEYKNISFVKQSDSIFRDISRCVSRVKNKYVSFFTDDNIVYREVGLNYNGFNSLEDLFNLNDACCLSLRLGKNTVTRDYGDGVLRPDNVPPLAWSDPYLLWNRTSIPPGGYWSYPLSVDGHIFKKQDMMRFCKELSILDKTLSFKQTPNEFEGKLQRFWFDIPPVMASLEYSCVVNSPNNRVQNHMQNWHGREFSYSPIKLNNMFRRGCRLDMEDIDFSDISCPHQEIDITKGLECY